MTVLRTPRIQAGLLPALLLGLSWSKGAEPVPLADEPARYVAGDAALPQALSRLELLRRDQTISFTGASAARARVLLQHRGDASPERRSAALLALASAGRLEDVPLIEAERKEVQGDLERRRALILAIGEMGAAGGELLVRISEKPAAGTEEHVALALARCGTSSSLRRIERAVGDSEDPLHAAARVFLALARGGAAPDPSPAFDLLMELRWRAARDFGLVGGRRYGDLIFEELLRSPEFLDRTVLAAAVERDSARVRDHLYQIVLRPGSPGRLRAAVAVMPITLARMMDEGVWEPAGEEEWGALLDEVAARRMERLAVDLLWLGWKLTESSEEGVPPWMHRVRRAAGTALLRAGQVTARTWLGRELAGKDLDRVREVIEALGDGKDAQHVPDLLLFVEPESTLEVRSAALVALTRLDHKPSKDALLIELQRPASIERDALLTALARAGHDPTFVNTMTEELRRGGMAPEVRFLLEVALARAGRLRTTHELEAWLRPDAPARFVSEVVRALARNADRDEYERMRDLFPVEGELELNVELASVLVRYRDPMGTRLLQTVLWDGPFNQSVLAASVLHTMGGLNSLFEELESPPPTATKGDLRRLGFAIGELGGLPAVEKLAGRRGPVDPALQGAYLGALSNRTR